MITIASWNINSIKARIAPVSAWLETHKPDFLLMQEIKCVSEAFPAAAFEEMGYHATVHGMPTYHGVATLSRHPVEVVSRELVPGDPQARFLDVAFGDWHVINIYAPNGNPIGTDKFEYKLSWLNHLCDYLEKLLSDRVKFVIGGDFNIIPEDIDAKDPSHWLGDALFQPQSRDMWKRLCYMGLIDAFRAKHPQEKAYTFWDYQQGAWNRNDGIRIDHFLLSPKAADRLQKCWIDREPRGGEKPSDHTPVLVTLAD